MRVVGRVLVAGHGRERARHLAFEQSQEFSGGRIPERRANAHAHMPRAREEPEIPFDALEETDHHVRVAARVPAAGHPAPLLRSGGQKGSPHQRIRPIRADDEIKRLFEPRERLHAAGGIDPGNPIVEVTGARFHRSPQQPRIELGPRHHPHRFAEVELDHQAPRGVETTALDAAGGKRIVRSPLGQKGKTLAGKTASAGLLAGMRRIEDRDRSALLRELEGGHGARGPGPYDADLHWAARISAGVTLEVPSFPTATPAARFESTIAS